MACCGPPQSQRDYDDWRYPRQLEWKRLITGEDVSLILEPVSMSFEATLLPSTTVEVPNPNHTRSAQQWFRSLPDDTARAIMQTRRSMMREQSISDAVMDMTPKPPCREPRPTADQGSGTRAVHQLGVKLGVSQPATQPLVDPRLHTHSNGLPPPVMLLIAQQQQQQQAGGLPGAFGSPVSMAGQQTQTQPQSRFASLVRSISPFKRGQQPQPQPGQAAAAAGPAVDPNAPWYKRRAPEAGGLGGVAEDVEEEFGLARPMRSTRQALQQLLRAYRSKSRLTLSSSAGRSHGRSARLAQPAGSTDPTEFVTALLGAALPALDPDGTLFGDRIFVIIGARDARDTAALHLLSGASPLASSSAMAATTASTALASLLLEPPSAVPAQHMAPGRVFSTLRDLHALAEALTVAQQQCVPLPQAQAASALGGRSPSATAAPVVVVTTSDRFMFGPLIDNVIECQPYRTEYGMYDDVLDTLATALCAPGGAVAAAKGGAAEVAAALRRCGLAPGRLQPSPVMQALRAQLAIKAATAARSGAGRTELESRPNSFPSALKPPAARFATASSSSRVFPGSGTGFGPGSASGGPSPTGSGLRGRSVSSTGIAALPGAGTGGSAASGNASPGASLTAAASALRVATSRLWSRLLGGNSRKSRASRSCSTVAASPAATPTAALAAELANDCTAGSFSMASAGAVAAGASMAAVNGGSSGAGGEDPAEVLLPPSPFSSLRVQEACAPALAAACAAAAAAGTVGNKTSVATTMSAPASALGTASSGVACKSPQRRALDQPLASAPAAVMSPVTSQAAAAAEASGALPVVTPISRRDAALASEALFVASHIDEVLAAALSEAEGVPPTSAASLVASVERTSVFVERSSSGVCAGSNSGRSSPEAVRRYLNPRRGSVRDALVAVVDVAAEGEGRLHDAAYAAAADVAAVAATAAARCRS
eukprot:XP_001697891.1 predicted protein [Chlamydomonas reinhardtii]